MGRHAGNIPPDWGAHLTLSRHFPGIFRVFWG
jgi:hypothetical protein